MRNEPLTPLVIPRNKWGVADNGGMLLDPDTELMCALGFACVARGIPKDVIRGKCMPSAILEGNLDDSIVQKRKHWLQGMLDPEAEDDCGACCEITKTNDSTTVTQAEREQYLIESFKEIGFALSFIGELPKKAFQD